MRQPNDLRAVSGTHQGSAGPQGESVGVAHVEVNLMLE